MSDRPPLPPLALAHRVGSLPSESDPLEIYDRIGRACRDQILRMLPDDWDLAGRSALDFGCGAGRTLRHFLGEAAEAEIWGCDVDRASIDWVDDHLCPPLHALRSAPEPPLDRPAASFDLVWAISVFTHLSDSWGRWLAELHRLLADDGLMIATCMGAGLSEKLGAGPWDLDRVGMNVLYEWQGWDLGGPFVFHSDWWLREHWGRAFEFVAVDERPAVEGELGRHSWLLLRRRQVEVTPEALEAPSSDPRELASIRHNVAQLSAAAGRFEDERREQRTRIRSLEARNVELESRVAELDAELARHRSLVADYESSLSWRITRPLRAARRLTGRRRP
jgi:SAM-dependent methyltransferase